MAFVETIELALQIWTVKFENPIWPSDDLRYFTQW